MPNASRRLAAAMLAAALSAAPLAAQDSTATDRSGTVAKHFSYHDAATARLLGTLIPGAGHIYAGEKLRGLGLSLTAISGILSGVMYYNNRDCGIWFFTPDTCESPTSQMRALGLIQVGVGVAAWVISAVDAPHAAERENERARMTRVGLAPLVRPRSGDGHTTVNAGLSINW